MRSLQTVKPKVSPLVNKNGEKTETYQETAQVLCDFFQEVFVTDNDASEDSEMPDADMNKIPLSFEKDKVKDLLLSLKTDKSPGTDGLHPMVLQRCAEEISLPLSI